MAARDPWLSSYAENIDWSMELAEVPLGEIFDESVARYGSRVCASFLGKETSYHEIGDLAARCAKGLQEMGIAKGDKVGILLPNCPIYIAVYFAILKIGATVVNYNPLYTVEELEFQVRDSETRVMITLDLALTFNKTESLLASGILERAIVACFSKLLPGFKSFLFRLFKSGEIASPGASEQVNRVTLFETLTGNDGKFRAARINASDDIAVLQYTGGTTGTPKGAMLSHGNLSVNIAQITAWATNLAAGEERMMGFLPFFHVFGMTAVMNFGVASGSEIVMVPRFELNAALKLIDKVGPTVMPGVPTLYNAMLNHPKIASYDLSTLKFCVSGGAPLPMEVKREFEAVAGCKLVEAYGLSETSPLVTCNPIEGQNKPGSIGIPVPQTRVSIRSLEDINVEMPIGEKGEICIAGPQVMKGYWQRPQETKDSFTDEYFRTGDVGYMDADGFIFIVDRLKDLILCSGYNVYPRQIEEAIYQFPAVEEVTVLGIPDDYRGEAPKAFIKLRAGEEASAQEILDFLKSKISKIEMPKEIEFRDELPKTMIGKLSKKELREEGA